MKNFILALVVFAIWGIISISYLKQTQSFNELGADFGTDQNAKPAKPLNVLNDDNSSKIYPDNTLLSTEMSSTVASIKNEWAKKDHSIEENNVPQNKENKLNVDILFPRFNFDELIVDEDLIDYATHLEQVISDDPATEITIIGHYYDENTSLDNYFEGLKRAKQLKKYVVKNFNLNGNFISAISEGNSRPINQDKNPNAQKLKNRIEVLLEN